MTQGIGRPRAPGSVAGLRWPRVSGRQTFCLRPDGVYRNESCRKPCPGNRTVVIETLAALGEQGKRPWRVRHQGGESLILRLVPCLPFAMVIHVWPIGGSVDPLPPSKW